MRSYGRRKRSQTRETGGHWLSFSDMMSVLVMVLIFVVLVSMTSLSEQEKQYAVALARLDESDTALTEKQSALTAQEEENARQALLLQTLQDNLDAQQTELDAMMILLGDREADLEAAKALLLTQQEQMDAQQLQLEQLVGIRSRIITTLSEALSANEIQASVDAKTGAITLKSEMLFATGSSTLSPSGQAYIDQFLPVYLNVLLSEEFSSYISEIIIEGHTDSVGDYLSNLELSQRRALSVASYILSDNSSLAPQTRTQLRPLMTANGRANSFPIYDANGNEDYDASRRVEFKFRLTDEQTISEMEMLLTQMQTSADNAATAIDNVISPTDVPAEAAETAAPAEAVPDTPAADVPVEG